MVPVAQCFPQAYLPGEYCHVCECAPILLHHYAALHTSAGGGAVNLALLRGGRGGLLVKYWIDWNAIIF